MPEGILTGVLIAALIYEFINGFHDTANAVATSVYTGALSFKNAILMAATMNFAGALFSEKVAMTISKGIICEELDQYVILCALIGGIVWNFITWLKGIPSSSTHALIGSLIGASIMYKASLKIVIWHNVIRKVILPLLISPLLGFGVGFIIMHVCMIFFSFADRNAANRYLLQSQRLSAAFVAYSHGSNDAQKTMGIITLSLVTSGAIKQDGGIPIWVKLACAFIMAAGTSAGGRKIIKTIGCKVAKLELASGFASQLSSALSIQGASFLGAPVSTTQVMSASVVGACCAKNMKAINWSSVFDIVKVWLFTLPATILLGGAAVFFVQLIM